MSSYICSFLFINFFCKMKTVRRFCNLSLLTSYYILQYFHRNLSTVHHFTVFWETKAKLYTFYCWKIWKITFRYIALLCILLFYCLSTMMLVCELWKCLSIERKPFNTLSAFNYSDHCLLHSTLHKYKRKVETSIRERNQCCMIYFLSTKFLLFFYLFVSQHISFIIIRLYFFHLLLQLIFHVCYFFLHKNFTFVFMTTFDNSCCNIKKYKKARQKNNIKFIFWMG